MTNRAQFDGSRSIPVWEQYGKEIGDIHIDFEYGVVVPGSLPFDYEKGTATLKPASFWKRLWAYPGLLMAYYRIVRKEKSRLIAFHMADTLAMDVLRGKVTAHISYRVL